MKPINARIIIGLVVIFLTTVNLLYSQTWQLGGNTDGAPPQLGLLTNGTPVPNFIGALGFSAVQIGTGNVSLVSTDFKREVALLIFQNIHQAFILLRLN